MMKNYDMNLVAVDNVFHTRNYTQKLRAYYKKITQKLQIGLLIATFLYIPVYCALWLFDVITIMSRFSVYCILSYFVLIAFFILMNREKHTFGQNPEH
jgi:FtsH-binding integral membrane protein